MSALSCNVCTMSVLSSVLEAPVAKTRRVGVYCGGKSKQTQWVWRQASERLLFNRNNQNKVSKGVQVSKINRGSGVLVLRGS